jgi:hypothetical protein
METSQWYEILPSKAVASLTKTPPEDLRKTKVEIRVIIGSGIATVVVRDCTVVETAYFVGIDDVQGTRVELRRFVDRTWRLAWKAVSDRGQRRITDADQKAFDAIVALEPREPERVIRPFQPERKDKKKVARKADPTGKPNLSEAVAPAPPRLDGSKVRPNWWMWLLFGVPMFVGLSYSLRWSSLLPLILMTLLGCALVVVIGVVSRMNASDSGNNLAMARAGLEIRAGVFGFVLVIVIIIVLSNLGG